MAKCRKFTIPRLTPEIQELFVHTVRITGRDSLACRRCAISKQTADQWLAKGKRQCCGRHRKFADAVSRAHADFLVAAAVRHHQLAMGGVIQLPVLDQYCCPVRDINGNVVYVEKVVMPNARALEWELEHLDPTIDEPTENEPEPPEKTPEEIELENAAITDPLTAAVKYLVDRGVALPQIDSSFDKRRRPERVTDEQSKE